MPDETTDAVVIDRTFAAPVERIWQMWTVPEHFQAWYGPTGATIPVANMDVRVGGARLVCMEVQTPDGPMQMWFSGEYLEVVEHQRLVYTEAVADEHGSPLVGSPDPDGLQVTEVRVEIPAGSPGEAGWAMAFDKLDATLAA